MPVSIQDERLATSSAVGQAAAPVTLKPADPVVAPESVNVLLIDEFAYEVSPEVRISQIIQIESDPFDPKPNPVLRPHSVVYHLCVNPGKRVVWRCVCIDGGWRVQ